MAVDVATAMATAEVVKAEAKVAVVTTAVTVAGEVVVAAVAVADRAGSMVLP